VKATRLATPVAAEMGSVLALRLLATAPARLKLAQHRHHHRQ
jgi:hypothetical protein